MNVLAALDAAELCNHRASEEVLSLVAESQSDDRLGHHHMRFMHHIAEQRNDSSSTVLDIGCGTGFSVYTLEDMLPHAKYTGVDISEAALAIARDRHPTKTFVHGNIYDLPHIFTHNSFQFFQAQGVLCHLSRNKMQQALRAIYAVIQPGGIGMLSMGIGHETEVVTEYLGQTFTTPMLIHHWDEDEFRTEITNAGFRIIDPVSCYGCNVMTDILQKT